MCILKICVFCSYACFSFSFILDTSNNISLYGIDIYENNIYLINGSKSYIHCEASSSITPYPRVVWYARDTDDKILILGVDGKPVQSKQPSVTTITISPAEEHHGMNLYCCMELSLDYQICTAEYNIVVKGIQIHVGIFIVHSFI